MRVLNLISILILSLLPWGCVVIYTEPKSGDTSNLKIINNHGYTFVSEGALCNKQKSVGARDRYIKVKSGVRIYIHNFYDSDQGSYETYCGGSVSFIPLYNENYVNEFTVDMEKGCKIRMYEVDKSGNQYNIPTAFSEDTSKC